MGIQLPTLIPAEAPGLILQTGNSVFGIIPVFGSLGIILTDSGTACDELLQIYKLFSLRQPWGVPRILINNLSLINLTNSAIPNGHELFTLAISFRMVRLSKMTVSLILKFLNLLWQLQLFQIGLHYFLKCFWIIEIILMDVYYFFHLCQSLASFKKLLL